MLRFILFITLPLYILDQVTKWWVVCTFKVPIPGVQVDTREVIPGFLNWTRVHNQGVAFGMGNGSSWAPLIFPFVLISAAVFIILAWRRGFFSHLLSRIAAALILSGIVGNFTDRLLQGFFLPSMAEESFFSRLTAGYVVDFVDVVLPFKIPFINTYHWPCFNVADSCISVAAVLIIISSFLEGKHREE